MCFSEIMVCYLCTISFDKIFCNIRWSNNSSKQTDKIKFDQSSVDLANLYPYNQLMTGCQLIYSREFLIAIDQDGLSESRFYLSFPSISECGTCYSVQMLSNTY